MDLQKKKDGVRLWGKIWGELEGNKYVERL
jgi:hypothetical protein